MDRLDKILLAGAAGAAALMLGIAAASLSAISITDDAWDERPPQLQNPSHVGAMKEAERR